MTNINLKSSDYLAISRAIDSNNNNLIDNDEASLVFKNKNDKSPSSVTKFANSLQKGDVIVSNVSKKSADNVANYFSDRSANSDKIMANWRKENTISGENLAIPENMSNLIDDDADDEVSTEEFSQAISSGNIQIGKSLNLRDQYSNKVIPNRMEEKFGKETTNLIRKFDKTPAAPYPKDYACDLKSAAIIDNTLLINDLECSDIYAKKPYQLIKEVFDTSNIKNDPELKAKVANFAALLSTNDKAALASMKNIFERKPGISNGDLKVIFDKLSTMMMTTYDPKIGNSKDLVIAALHDVAMPTDISQGLIGTCTGTSVQIQMAMRNPVEYLKMLDTLAQNKNYTTIKGSVVPPNFTFTEEGSNGQLNTGRTISSKIMQNAIMDFGDGDTRIFNSAKADGGMIYQQTSKALNEIVNLNVESSAIWDYNPNQLMSIAKNSKPSWENPIEISLSYEKSGRDARHSVNLVNISDTQVTIVNPWGREETFPTEELQKRILSVSNTVGTEKNVTKINLNDLTIKNKLADNSTKNQVLEQISVEQKFDLIRDITSSWDVSTNAYKLNTPPISETDKKVVLNILDDMLGGEAQNTDWYPRLKWIAPNKTELLQKLQSDKEIYLSVKERLSATYLK